MPWGLEGSKKPNKRNWERTLPRSKGAQVFQGMVGLTPHRKGTKHNICVQYGHCTLPSDRGLAKQSRLSSVRDEEGLPWAERPGRPW